MVTLLKEPDYVGNLKGLTPFYRPPELMNEDEENFVSSASDIWNIGVMAFYMKFKSYPVLSEIMKEIGK
jgi:serine/threonine protein kinase